jgi:hypothetical protein
MYEILSTITTILIVLAVIFGLFFGPMALYALYRLRLLSVNSLPVDAFRTLVSQTTGPILRKHIFFRTHLIATIDGITVFTIVGPKEDLGLGHRIIDCARTLF